MAALNVQLARANGQGLVGGEDGVEYPRQASELAQGRWDD
jgi:hypothetical protein